MPAVDQAPPTPCPICDPCGGGCDHEGAPGHRPRTLPVTPAERACATVLRAYLDYQPAPGDYDVPREMIRLFDGVETLLRDFGFVGVVDTDATPVGTALLARVEAAERTPETLARDLVMALQTNGAPGVLVSEAQSVLVNARARRLAGTTPIDAPPAKEPR